MSADHCPTGPSPVPAADVPAPDEAQSAAPVHGQLAAQLAASFEGTLVERLGMEVLSMGAGGGTMRMPVAGSTQPAGLLHGGATIALAESIASLAAVLRAREVHGEGAQAVGHLRLCPPPPLGAGGLGHGDLHPAPPGPSGRELSRGRP
jgi:1,4-dihydroxy-2-naphthoyl-CoA hydrolase